jgi:hypothetical protein
LIDLRWSEVAKPLDQIADGLDAIALDLDTGKRKLGEH